MIDMSRQNIEVAAIVGNSIEKAGEMPSIEDIDPHLNSSIDYLAQNAPYLNKANTHSHVNLREYKDLVMDDQPLRTLTTLSHQN